jgi:hypothetical protein
MLVDDFVFVLNAVQGMKLSMERKVEAFSKGTVLIFNHNFKGSY